jgi:hypothetical protein
MATGGQGKQEKDVLRIENFKGKFNTKDFIESLSGKLMESFKDNEFNPSPYIRTFESVTEVSLSYKGTASSEA